MQKIFIFVFIVVVFCFGANLLSGFLGKKDLSGGRGAAQQAETGLRNSKNGIDELKKSNEQSINYELGTREKDQESIKPIIDGITGERENVNRQSEKIERINDAIDDGLGVLEKIRTRK